MSSEDSIKGFGTGFFKSLTSHFKSSNNNDRNKIDSKTISHDSKKQEIFDQVRNGPISSRAKAAEQIAIWIYDFNLTSIPDIWYCAKDLIDPTNQQIVRRSGFILLSSCVDIDSNDPDIIHGYFNDTLANYQFSKDKLDPQLDKILEILQKLTDNGSFIHHYQEVFKQPTIEFLIHTLSSNEITKNINIQILLTFTIDSIKSGLLNHSDSEIQDKNVEHILSLIFKLSLKTSDKLILDQCIQIINSIIIYYRIPKNLIYKTLEIVCGSVILDLHFHDLGSEVLMNLINKINFKTVFEILLDLIYCKESKTDKNINGAIGSIRLLNFLFKDFAFQIDIETLIQVFEKTLEWNKPNLNVAILQFFNDTILQNLSISQINLKTWDDGDISILIFLNSISKKISRNDEIELYKLSLVQLQSLAESSRYPGSLLKLAYFFIENARFLSIKISIYVIRYFVIEDLCSHLTPNWKENLDLLLDTFYKDTSKDATVRLSVLKLLNDLLENAMNESTEKESILYQISDILFENLETEQNFAIVETIIRYFVDISLTLTVEQFTEFNNRYILPGFTNQGSNSIFSSERRSSIRSTEISAVTKQIQFPEKTAIIIGKGYVNLFCQLLHVGGTKASFCYNTLIIIAQFAKIKKDVDLLLITSRLFVRIRASAEKQVYLTNPTDIDGLSAAFARNLALRKNKDLKIAAGSLDEKWTYPEEIDYIPLDILDKPSKNLIFIDQNSDKLITDPAIDIEKWLTIVIDVLESAPHWEIYSYIYAHFCPQLSNIRLFETCGELIRKFRSLICDQLTLKLPSNLTLPEQMTKHDLQVAIVRNFTPLISYHGIFSKADEDQIINALIVGLSSWEKTAIPCIHILTVCCYELPLSIKKYLPVIMTKLQTRISSAFASAHILEFLLSLSYIPELTSNFTVEEFKRAFGITFKLIQYSHDISQLKDNNHNGVLHHGEELSADILPSTESLEITPVISIYLLSVSYDVIANWFLNMKLVDRRQLSSFIMKNLILSQSNRGSEINNQNMSFLDLITRFTYSDLELKFNSIIPQKFTEGSPVLSSKWVFGNSLIAIDTHSETGESIITIRRASGSTIFRVTPDESMIPLYTNQLHSKNEDDLFTANYILLQLIVHSDLNHNNKPIPIPDEVSMNRSIANFDRIPVVEFHKIGLLYIGPNQTSEQEILGNTGGSIEYERFLSKFGRLIKLKNCKSFYVGGLDVENDADGEFAYGWNDKILQLVFHTTTLMPNNESDPNYSLKKRHIGNNHVNIFFDESGQQFDFNIIKSQFNFLNIVITPHSVSFEDKKSSNNGINKYKVKVYRRSGVPALFATCHFKIVSEQNLATFVRTLSLVADQFAQVWHSNGSYSSNWSHRMKQITQIKEKSLKSLEDMKEKQKSEDPNNSEQSKSASGQSFLEQLSDSSNKQDSNTLSRSNTISRPKNKNVYEIPDSDDNEHFKNLEFNSFTR
ncbi:hypothetical protein WICMUC_002148 [Wickerhamomyces mucosus]|uniref:Rap-GAP domain-containing protein n=1 Tax=Wickerhamomyces mucosus TaxID=1378264 RepID=A0A9P8PQC5_9ASCO|nr:hypothetical protein WICMUC_002148 [Wickerhamomyces mucosus]